MAISEMAKVLVVSHRSEAAEVLEQLQSCGICQLLNAEEAMVSKDWPDLVIAAERPRQLEELLGELTKSVAFLKNYAELPGGLGAAFAPKTVINKQKYSDVVADAEVLEIAKQCQGCEEQIEKLKTESENLHGVLDGLEPWSDLETRVEQLGELEKVSCLTGFLSSQKAEQIETEAGELGAVVQQVGTTGTKVACLIVCLNENTADVQKLLRSADFEAVSFEGMTGTIAELIAENRKKLSQSKEQLQGEYEKAGALSENLLKLEILCDHYSNLVVRERARAVSPATNSTIIFEGWAKEKDYTRLEKIVSQFGASSVSRIEPGEGEETPIEIENNKFIKPFEMITRLYGMPAKTEVDPTVFLAPFFAIFFGICMTDVGYGVVMAGLLWWMMKKMQGDKGALMMFFMCSITTIIAGVLTGGWFGDAIQNFVPVLSPMRDKLMLFDPMKEPPKFFALALGLGYFQILFGLGIGFVNSLRNKDYATAIFNYLTWLIFLNSLLLFGVAKAGFLPSGLSTLFGWLAISQAVLILGFSERKSGMSGRVGGGVFALFSTVFYFGDVLSYVRLMALGMVAAGLGMAINILVKLVMPVPYIGWFLGVIMFIGGHTVNLALSMLSSFVHSLRLQFVEFFPKFIEGGGRDFKPLKKAYEHIMVEDN